jgi:hypothetical protein
VVETLPVIVDCLCRDESPKNKTVSEICPRHEVFFKMNNYQGHKVSSVLNWAVAVAKKHSRVCNQLTFLHKCKCQQLIPHGFRLKLHFPHLSRSRNIVRDCSRQLVLDQISYLHRVKWELSSELWELKSDLERLSSPPEFIRSLRLIEIRQNSELLREKERLLKKFAALKKEQEKDLFPVLSPEFVESVVVNASSRALTNSEKEVLALGPNYAIQPKEVPVSDYVAAIESGFYNDPKKSMLAHSVIQLVQSHNLSQPNLSLAHREALTSLSRDVKEQSIVI